ncbi:helix-turn-helix transcriptional regulator [Spirochaeta cellobiosiphila]|uniref:helix-turn-helix transcriptional regulator n=1 Tax=Spirochaeta cellobiosiphila TaxID=504483 RepID=UPI00041A3283|nr:YafY family protein [Spirochaeta cellobiosiphila]
MSKMRRLIDIWLYINRVKRFTAQEIGVKFNISLRTVQRDLLELTEMGVPFYSEVGRNGGYVMLNNEVLPPISFTEEETASIILTYESLKQYQDIPYKIEIDSVIRKLLGQVSEPLQKKLLSLKDYVLMKIPNRKEENPFLREIFQAAIIKQQILFSYDSLREQKDKTAVPLGIYSENGYWYFPAYDLLYERISLFRVDRVKSIKGGESIDINLPTIVEWMNLKKQNVDENTCTLVLQISRRATRDFSNSFFDFSKITWNENGTGILLQEISENEFQYIASLIATFGSEAKILAPQKLKDILILKLKKTISLY